VKGIWCRTDVEVKVADPVVTFCETIVETSSLQCFAETPNHHNKLTMVAEPLDIGLGDAIERGAIKMTQPRREIKEYLMRNHGWDALAVRSLWAFGPDAHGPNVLLDDTLAGVAVTAKTLFTPSLPFLKTVQRRSFDMLASSPMPMSGSSFMMAYVGCMVTDCTGYHSVAAALCVERSM